MMSGGRSRTWKEKASCIHRGPTEVNGRPPRTAAPPELHLLLEEGFVVIVVLRATITRYNADAYNTHAHSTL
jgi:hypothetical protein